MDGTITAVVFSGLDAARVETTAAITTMITVTGSTVINVQGLANQTEAEGTTLARFPSNVGGQSRLTAFKL